MGVGDGFPARAPHPPVNPGMQARPPGAMGFLAHDAAEAAVAADATTATGAFYLSGAPGCGGWRRGGCGGWGRQRAETRRGGRGDWLAIV